MPEEEGVGSECVRGPGCAEAVPEPATRSPDPSEEEKGMPAVAFAEVHKHCPWARTEELFYTSVSAKI